MAYLKISNDGNIDIKAFTKIGCSSKANDDTKIGQFGSGLNYAIAWLLRNEIKFHAFAGLKEVQFDVIDSVFRGEPAKFIVIDGWESSFATTLGGDIWTSWMAIREIYCNALDEPNGVKSIVDEVIPERDKTTIFIEINEDIQEVIDNWNYYFSYDREDMLFNSGKGVKLFKGNGKNLVVYRKGIKCFDYNAPSIFHYDIDNLEINESRIVKDSWDLDRRIAQILAKQVPEEILQELIENIQDSYEYRLNWDWYDVYFDVDKWSRVLQGKKIVEDEHKELFKRSINRASDPVISLPASMVKNLKRFSTISHVAGATAENDQSGEKQIFTHEERTKVDNAINKLHTLGYYIKYDVRKFASTDSNVKSTNVNGQILITANTVNVKIEELMQILMYEQIRIQYKEIPSNTVKPKFENFIVSKFFNHLKSK